ncbi:hypothetical protein BU24DRAFT_63355 [Aaosphaeria arxii CBS 175.79]|uniref:Uncharacterized protein n=1 Tax=Aaosphaeria arxii CBS 175.79 TaxID=1450172 RepID=A0A6A5XD51_9PLEO|nr:uncharacterized protein BU24DRAFT_63355 [Aaosphaeria arxii CBS 175.79]KAF2010694.1 hypothetical protein BU24DRAFT_63355 [Aaosphaeria arxii CBS 175.79]
MESNAVLPGPLQNSIVDNTSELSSHREPRDATQPVPQPSQGTTNRYEFIHLAEPRQEGQSIYSSCNSTRDWIDNDQEDASSADSLCPSEIDCETSDVDEDVNWDDLMEVTNEIEELDNVRLCSPSEQRLESREDIRARTPISRSDREGAPFPNRVVDPITRKAVFRPSTPFNETAL